MELPFSGQIIDQATGRGLGGLKVDVLPSEDGAPVGNGVTQSDGNFQMTLRAGLTNTNSPSERLRLFLRVHVGDQVVEPQPIWWRPEDSPHPIPVELPAAVRERIELEPETAPVLPGMTMAAVRVQTSSRGVRRAAQATYTTPPGLSGDWGKPFQRRRQ